MVKRRANRTGDRDGAGPRDGPGPRAAEMTERERRVLDQYLARYAEPEAAYGEQLTHRYRVAVVAPLCAESPAVVDQWETLLVERSSRAGEVPGGDRAGALVLWIAVVNAREDAPDDVLRSNQEVLEGWRASSRSVRRLTPPERHPHGRAPAAAELLVRGEGHHVLLIDASSPGHRFPLKQGVGLARRIGCDVAVALVRRGHLTVRYVGSADGDARLPPGYLCALDREPSAMALLFPFEHVSEGDRRVLEATQLVELSWRYYVLGLAWAGSPFAYHTVGSCLAPEVVAYAQARGFPRREAAEDFHVLAKLAKLGEVESLAEPRVQLTARVSDRVPFGTGPAVRRALAGADRAEMGSSWEHLTLHDPRVFVALRALLRALRELATGTMGDGVLRDLAKDDAVGGAPLPREVRRALEDRIDQWCRLLGPRLTSCPTEAHRLRRVFESFDALATLQAVHAFRDAGLAPLPWRRALEGAPFLPAGLGISAREALELARSREASLAARRGLAPGRAAGPHDGPPSGTSQWPPTGGAPRRTFND